MKTKNKNKISLTIAGTTMNYRITIIMRMSTFEHIDSSVL